MKDFMTSTCLFFTRARKIAFQIKSYSDLLLFSLVSYFPDYRADSDGLFTFMVIKYVNILFPLFQFLRN